MDKKIGLLYLSLHNYVLKRHGVGRVITRKEFLYTISVHFLIPREWRPLIIKEFIRCGLVERINRDKLLLKESPVDITKQDKVLSHLFDEEKYTEECNSY